MPVQRLDVAAYTIPTEQPEADGTLEWSSTTIVVVHAHAGGETGVGYTYAHEAAATYVREKLAPLVEGSDAMDIGQAWSRMWHESRNQGQSGQVSYAISAVDVALWDLKAKLMDVPLVVAIDAFHEAVPIYGSGGFCNYADDQLQDQLRGWIDAGIPRVKMKVGRHPGEDERRVRAAREAIGDGAALMVDANGAYTRKDALEWAYRYAEHGVQWYEEPVTSDDLEGLRLLRDRGPGGMDIAAGEYGWSLPYFHTMLDAGAVDCLQADVTRCGGVTAVRQVGALCSARSMELSAHTAPQISAHAFCAVWHLRHLEYFHDHVRIENLLFDGCLEPEPGGVLRPDRSRAGMGITFKAADAERLAA